jgi:hypothetical protein
MKKLGICVAVLFVLVALGMMVVLVMAKTRYDETKHLLRDTRFVVAPMDEQSSALLADVESNWTCEEQTTNAIVTEALRSAGLPTSVANVVHLLKSPWPDFPWWPMSECRQTMGFAMTKMAYSLGTNQIFYVSDDERCALLLCSPHVAVVFHEDRNGVQETVYFKR